MGTQPLADPAGSAGPAALGASLAGAVAAFPSAPDCSRSESTIFPPFSTPNFTSSVILFGLMSTWTFCGPCGVVVLDTWYQPRYHPTARNATAAAPTRARMFRMVGSFSDWGNRPGPAGRPHLIARIVRAVQRGRQTCLDSPRPVCRILL